MSSDPGRDDESVVTFRKRYFRGDFTRFHEKLVDISIGRLVPNEKAIDPQILSSSPAMSVDGLEQLALMIQVEFLESLKREVKGTEDAAGTRMLSDPHVYDVWLMETTIDMRNRRLAICVPIRRNNDICWYDGLTDLWAVDPPCHKWRLASLSGPARTLAALHSRDVQGTLMGPAMRRDLIVEAIDDDVRAEALLQSRLSEILLKKLNSSQRQAVATLIDPTFQRGFLAVQGPPGTGKSTALVAMIVALREKDGNLLVVAPSNAAVANLALKAWMTGLFRLTDLLVYGDNADESVRFLNPIFRGEQYSKTFKGFDALDTTSQEIVCRKLSEWLHMDSEFSASELRHFCPFIDRKTTEGRNFYAKLISKANIVFCTLNSSGASVLRNNVAAHTLLLDEAGQCTEAEFYIAASFPTVERMVVIGDPKQLPATVIHYACRLAGLGKSWLEKVQSLYPRKVHVLDIQYRMDPCILAFPNATFYNDRINSGESVHGRTPYVEFPFLFMDTDGKGHEELDDFSYRNVYEVTVVKNLLFQDPDIVRLIESSVEKCRVIVISPYKAQVALLREHMAKLLAGSKCEIEIATVDSFQGQEGDIVIMCTVRTHRAGFIDDAQRVNVSVTRAKRILRVVGDARFFESLGASSTLYRLVQFAKAKDLLAVSKIQSLPWTPPNWQIPCLWKPTMSSRYHHCIRRLSKRDKYICMNTLLAIAQGNVQALDGGTITQLKKGLPTWHMTHLRGFSDNRIVWYAKILDTHAIEAVFAGSRNACIKFMADTSVPPEARVVQSDLSGVKAMLDSDENNEEIEDADLVLSWRVTNTMQQRMLNGDHLPRTSVQLDQSQEAVCSRQPPLVIESRSGTGKTLVLIQHAAYHFDEECGNDPACFVTVSPGLREELQTRFKEMNESENLLLPETHFYTFEQLLASLLRLSRIHEFDGHRRCTFLGFKRSQRSFEREKLEPQLVENEIGGVIIGSLVAACQRHPLTREQYKTDVRSNVGRHNERQLQMRDSIYDEYESYTAWKRATKKYDIGDIVMRLLKEDWKEYFSSLYLDEVQDFSYAAIFLLFQLGGKSRMRWICAGDPAQMISPGCSFTFDGLKQVMLAVRKGIEKHLKGVSHLFVNYRTTKDVLEVANEVLDVIRSNFPGAISFSRRERARKDLKMKIVLCDRSLALEQSVKLKANQAIVFSSKDPEKTEGQLTAWVGNHPFILSSADAKGLEFDDVIVVFDHDRKTWQPSRQNDATLRMLRELYVAITRAQRQLVILLDRSVPTMIDFFRSMEYDFHQDGAEMVLRDFDTISSSYEWLQKAEGFIANGQFRLAARCYNLSGDKAMFHWSSGKFYETQGDDPKAVEQFQLALDAFASNENFEKVLEVSVILSQSEMAAHGVWTNERKSNVDKAMVRRPDHLPRWQMVKLSLARGSWENVRIEDLCDNELSSLFAVYRKNVSLKKIVGDASSEERLELLRSIPSLIGDYHFDRNDFVESVAAHLLCPSTQDAEAVTKHVMKLYNSSTHNTRKDDLLRIVAHWNGSSKLPGYPISLLLELFHYPEETAKESFKECMTCLGRSIVVLAVVETKKSHAALFDIDPSEFYAEVTSELTSQLQDHVKVVQWFCERGNVLLGLQYAKQHVKKLTTRMMSFVAALCGDVPSWMISEAERRTEVGELLLRLMASTCSFYQKQIHIKAIAEKLEELNDHSDDLSLLVWCFAQFAQGPKKAKSNRRNTSRVFNTRKKSPQLSVENAQYCAIALSNVWPDLCKDSRVTEQELSESECISLLSFLFEATDPPLQAHFVSAAIKRTQSAGLLASLLEMVLLRQGLQMPLAANLTKKVMDNKIGAYALQRANEIWLQYFERNDSFEALPGLLLPLLTDLFIAAGNYVSACRVVCRALNPHALTPHQLEAVMSSSASSLAMIDFALVNDFTEVAIAVTAYILKTSGDIFPILLAWNSVSAKFFSRTPQIQNGERDVPSFLSTEKSLLSLLMIVSQDVRCLISEGECFHRLLLAFGPKLVAYGHMYTGLSDLDSGLFQSVTLLHDEIRRELPRLERGAFPKSSSSPRQSSKKKTEQSNRISSTLKPDDAFSLRRGFLIDNPNADRKRHHTNPIRVPSEESGLPQSHTMPGMYSQDTGNMDLVEETGMPVRPESSGSTAINQTNDKKTNKTAKNNRKKNKRKSNKKKKK